MNPCNGNSVDILHYLDNELSGQELDEFRTHLKGCADCQALLEEEQELSHILHRSRPLYPAPAALRACVSADLVRHAGQTFSQAGSTSVFRRWFGRRSESHNVLQAGRYSRSRLW
jgi:anti-sigma factor RsiW